MKCDVCGKEIDNEWHEIRGGLGNKHITNICPECYDKYVKYSIERIKEKIKQIKSK